MNPVSGCQGPTQGGWRRAQAELSGLVVAPKVKVPAPAPPLQATVTLASQQLCELAAGDAAGAAAAAAAPLEVPALRLAACAAAQVGREHARLGQVRLLHRPWGPA